MVSVFLPAYPFRGVKAPYLWFFYRVLSSMKEPVYFMMGNDYLSSLEQWESEKRWELEEDSQRRLGFQLPDLSQLSDKHNVSVIDESYFNHYMAKCFNNPDELFKKFITEVIPELEEVLFAALSQESHIECVLTWCNCPSLNAAAKRRNIKVVNLELGPLRSPEYLSTAYFDFSGVNGNTEAERRYLSSDYRFNMNVQVEQLREFFTGQSLEMRQG
ncbi:GT99 family glycosyltransferase N-terminal domain-containing protein, partial [Serratia marcescens]|uniref:GT99 family glycosyltransferase N-terminal domain-containing protein n=1 Tax=Serratia marcescens TaxID=615 RepID=UPI000FA3AF60